MLRVLLFGLYLQPRQTTGIVLPVTAQKIPTDDITLTAGYTNAHWLEGGLIAQQVHLFLALK